jgi:sigma-E factor negative regulatory protein RseA
MSEKFQEQLSSLMDGELPRDELRFLLRRMDADSELAQCWSRYQLVRNSIRRQPILSLRADFSQVLMQRIDLENAPGRARAGGVLLRWAGGGAIAAAVAVVALVATRPPIEGPSASVAVLTAPALPVDTHVATGPLPSLVNFDYAQPASYDIPRYDVRRRFETSGVGTVNGITPYLLIPAPQRAQPDASNKTEEAVQP